MFKNLREAIKPEILLPRASDMPKVTDGTFRWMWFFIKPTYSLYGAMLVVRIIRLVSFSMIIYFFSLLIDTLSSGVAFNNPALVWHNIVIAGIYYLVLMASYIFMAQEDYMIDKTSRGLTLFSVNHLLALPLEWHEQQGSGAKLQRVMQARDNFALLYEQCLYNLLPFLAQISATIFAMMAMKVPRNIYLLFAGYIISYLIITSLMNRIIDRLQDQISRLKETLVSRVYDFVSLIRMTKSFNLRSFVETKAYEQESIGHKLDRKAILFIYSKWVLSNISIWIWVVTIVVVSFRLALDKKITPGAFAAIVFLAHRLWFNLEDMNRFITKFFTLKAGFIRIRETLCTAVQNYDVAPIVEAPKEWQQIECSDLEFSYNVEQPVLKNINLTIPRNKYIALIGHSGAGKSTMVKLLMKHVMPTAGDIRIGDASLQNIASDDWLSHLALVPQDVELMNATLRENILLDRNDIDEEFYRECLRKSYLEEFIAALPEGDNTEIGERGVKLSGGQKQRLGIARALARNADIIILDEATSSLDSESEAFIQRAMETAFTDKTVIVIAHRLSTIRHADIIYVFDKGVIAESGDFQTLEQSNGIFARLWAMQSNGFIAN